MLCLYCVSLCLFCSLVPFLSLIITIKNRFGPIQTIENQDELRGALASIKELQETIQVLEVQRDELESKVSDLEIVVTDHRAEELKTQVSNKTS